MVWFERKRADDRTLADMVTDGDVTLPPGSVRETLEDKIKKSIAAITNETVRKYWLYVLEMHKFMETEEFEIDMLSAVSLQNFDSVKNFLEDSRRMLREFLEIHNKPKLEKGGKMALSVLKIYYANKIKKLSAHAANSTEGGERSVFCVSDLGAPAPPPVGNIMVREDGRASFGASEGVKCGVFGNMLDTTAQNLITANSANFGRLSASARQAVNKINERGGHEGVVRILLVFIGITSSEYPNDVRNILREVGDDTMNRVDLEIAIGRSNNDMMSFNLFNEIFRGDSFDSFDLGAAWGFLVVHMGSHGIDNLTTTSYLAAFIDNNISVEEKRV